VVAWKVISADGHVVGGALTFSIGAPTKGGGPAAAGTTSTPTSVIVLRWLAALMAGVGLVAAATLSLLRRRADVMWNVGFAAAVLLAPLHQLVEDGRGLADLTDWLVWLDGVTRPSSLLLLAAYALVAAARSTSQRLLAAVALLPALVLLGGAAYSWPAAHPAQTPAAAPAGPATTTAQLGSSGTVALTTAREAGRAVTFQLQLLDTSGQPLEPYATPTLAISNADLTLGDATVTRTGPGTYRAEVTIPTDGQWSAQVSVRVDEFTNPVADVPFKVT